MRKYLATDLALRQVERHQPRERYAQELHRSSEDIHCRAIICLPGIYLTKMFPML
jgi:hypothetical protein